MPKKCRICGFDNGHNFKCPKKTPPKPELVTYTNCVDCQSCIECGLCTCKPSPHITYEKESVDALIEWYEARLKEMRK